MNFCNRFKKAILLALFIAMVPAQSHAAWYDSFFSSVKENIVAIASVAFGAASIFGLMWWKTRSDLNKLKKSKTTDIAQAKAEGKKEAEDAAAKSKASTPALDNKDSLANLAAAHEADKKTALEKLSTTKDLEKESEIAKLKAAHDAEKKHELEALATQKDAARDTALAQQKTTNDREKVVAFKTFATQAGDLKQKLDTFQDQEKAKIDAKVNAFAQKTHKLAGSAKTLQSRYKALRLKHKAALSLLQDYSLIEFLNNAQEMCGRAEKASANQGKQSSIKELQELIEVLDHILKRLHTLIEITANRVSYTIPESYEIQNPYLFLEISPLFASIMSAESIRAIIEKRIVTSNPVKTSLLVLFENEFSKKHFDLSLKGTQQVNTWIAFIKTHLNDINSLHERIDALRTKMTAIISHYQQQQGKALSAETAQHVGIGTAAAPTKAPSAAAKPAAKPQEREASHLTSA